MNDKLEQLFARIEENEDKKIIYNDEFLGMELELKRLSLRKFAELQEGADKGTVKAVDTIARVIYEHTPLFQDTELLEKCKVKVNKYAVVSKIYNENMGAMTKLYKFINDTIYGAAEEETETGK